MYESAEIGACRKARCCDENNREFKQAGLEQLSGIIENFRDCKSLHMILPSAAVMPALVR